MAQAEAERAGSTSRPATAALLFRPGRNKRGAARQVSTARPYKKNLNSRRISVKRNALYYCTLGLVTAVTFAALSHKAAGQGKDSLYKRLGGYDAIAVVTDDFIGRLATDKQLGKFFIGLSDDSKKRVRQHVVDQLCQATGGPCVYTGRDMKTSHRGLGISEDDWNIGVKHLVATLNKFKVPEAEQKELAAALMGLKADIVEKR
jgi:hemoglobin